MGWFNDDHDFAQNASEVDQEPKAKLSHEVLGGAAAWKAMEEYEKHCAKEGRPDSHARAKELAAGFAGAFLDREFETRAIPYEKRELAKRHAQQQLDDAIDQQGY